MIEELLDLIRFAKDANRIASMAEDILSSQAVPADKVPVERSRLLPNRM